MSQANKIAYLEDEKIKIARGQVKGVIPVQKLGAVDSVSTSTTSTIWDVNDTIYPWSSWASANTVVANSSDASDVGKSVVIEGLDENYDLVTDEIEFSSQTGNVNGQQFIRIFRVYMGNGDVNVGTITITKGGTTVAAIKPQFSQSLMAVYTIPRNYTGYLYQGNCSAQYQGDGTGFMYVREGGTTAFRVAHTFEINGSGSPYSYIFSIPQEIPEKSDIDVRIYSRSNNSRYTAAFELILVKMPNT